METMHLEKPWADTKEKLKEISTELTDEDLEYTPGQEQALLERLAKKMNRDVAHVKDWIESVSGNAAKAG